MRKIIIGILLLVVGLGVFLMLAIQIVPYGRNHANPPIVSEPKWDSPETRQLFKRSCFDCHSNETNWPWYSNIAPASWLVQHDVEEGRGVFNFSDWQNAGMDAGEIAETLDEGKMPPAQYLLIHANLKPSSAETQKMIQGIVQTLK